MITAPQVESAVATTPQQTTRELDALLHRSGVCRLDDLGWMEITGADRVRWLNGMVTNSIQALAPGQGCYNFVLSAQGRIQGTLTAFAREDSILLETGLDQVSALLTLLDRFIIMDEVELAHWHGFEVGVGVIGPGAETLLRRLGVAGGGQPPPSMQPVLVQGEPALLVAAHSPVVPRFELWVGKSAANTVLDTLTAAGATLCGGEALEHLRILEGTPRYGTDIRNTEIARDLPQETNQNRALHFSKGCYLGQEIVERIRSRGNVHRTFTGFRLDGPLPPPSTPIVADGKPVGELTSTAAVPLSGGTVHLALGYLRRDALERDATLTYSEGRLVAVPLPFPDR